MTPDPGPEPPDDDPGVWFLWLLLGALAGYIAGALTVAAWAASFRGFDPYH